MEELGFFFVYYMVTLLISLVISIGSYLLTAFGIFNMGKSLGVKNPWLSFIPYANIYAFGRIAEHYNKKDGRPSAKFSKILLILNIVTVVVALGLIIAILVGAVLEAISHPDMNAYFESEEFAVNGLYTFILPLLLGTLVIMGLAIANAIITYVALWRIYSIFDPETATVYLVLSIFFSILQPIFIFILRNKQPQIFMPQPIQQIPQPQQENIM